MSNPHNPHNMHGTVGHAGRALPLLTVTNLEVRYGDLIGVADVSLEVPKGATVALLGSDRKSVV